ncbi:hypothetical protein LJC42_08215 [Eubacteriales bacterium OttesenSCG-928-K08]|nr:hypothetical protein [Eubacteriales bacterium OttesenSCG-928-K08]
MNKKVFMILVCILGVLFLAACNEATRDNLSYPEVNNNQMPAIDPVVENNENQTPSIDNTPHASIEPLKFYSEDELVAAIVNDKTTSEILEGIDGFYKPSYLPEKAKFVHIAIKKSYIAYVYDYDGIRLVFQEYRGMKSENLEPFIQRTYPDIHTIIGEYYVIESEHGVDVHWSQDGKVFLAAMPHEVFEAQKKLMQPSKTNDSKKTFTYAVRVDVNSFDSTLPEVEKEQSVYNDEIVASESNDTYDEISQCLMPLIFESEEDFLAALKADKQEDRLDDILCFYKPKHVSQNAKFSHIAIKEGYIAFYYLIDGERLIFEELRRIPGENVSKIMENSFPGKYKEIEGYYFVESANSVDITWAQFGKLFHANVPKSFAAEQLSLLKSKDNKSEELFINAAHHDVFNGEVEDEASVQN